MANGEYNATISNLLHGPEDAVDLGGSGDDTDADVAAHEPVLGDGEVVRAIDVFERLDLLFGGEEELRLVCAAFC